MHNYQQQPPMFDPRMPVDDGKRPQFYTGLGGDSIGQEAARIRLEYVAAFVLWALAVKLLHVEGSKEGLDMWMAWIGAYMWVLGAALTFYLPGKELEISESGYLFGIGYSLAGIGLSAMTWLAKDGGKMQAMISNVSIWIMVLVPISYTVYMINTLGLFRTANRRVQDRIADQMRQMR